LIATSIERPRRRLRHPIERNGRTGPFRERYCSRRRLTQTCRPGTSPAPRQINPTTVWPVRRAVWWSRAVTRSDARSAGINSTTKATAVVGESAGHVLGLCAARQRYGRVRSSG